MPHVPHVVASEHSYVQAGVVEGDNVDEVKKQKAIKGLLNKITPEKFDKILQDIIDVGYETEQTESGLIDQVGQHANFLPIHCNCSCAHNHFACRPPPSC